MMMNTSLFKSRPKKIIQLHGGLATLKKENNILSIKQHINQMLANDTYIISPASVKTQIDDQISKEESNKSPLIKSAEANSQTFKENITCSILNEDNSQKIINAKQNIQISKPSEPESAKMNQREENNQNAIIDKPSEPEVAKKNQREEITINQSSISDKSSEQESAKNNQREEFTRNQNIIENEVNLEQQQKLNECIKEEICETPEKKKEAKKKKAKLNKNMEKISKEENQIQPIQTSLNKTNINNKEKEIKKLNCKALEKVSQEKKEKIEIKENKPKKVQNTFKSREEQFQMIAKDFEVGDEVVFVRSAYEAFAQYYSTEEKNEDQEFNIALRHFSALINESLQFIADLSIEDRCINATVQSVQQVDDIIQSSMKFRKLRKINLQFSRKSNIHIKSNDTQSFYVFLLPFIESDIAPHIVPQKHFDTSIREWKVGSHFSVPFVDPNTQEIIWDEGRIFRDNSKEEGKNDPYNAYDVMWYEVNSITGQWMISLLQNAPRMSAWELYPSKEFTRTDDLKSIRFHMINEMPFPMDLLKPNQIEKDQNKFDESQINMTQLFRFIIEEIEQCEGSAIFNKLITDEQAPGYSLKISKPICLEIIKSKIQNDETIDNITSNTITYNYPTWNEFASDIRLMFNNCLSFNIEQRFENTIAKLVSSIFETRDKQVRQIIQQMKNNGGMIHIIKEVNRNQSPENKRQKKGRKTKSQTEMAEKNASNKRKRRRLNEEDEFEWQEDWTEEKSSSDDEDCQKKKKRGKKSNSDTEYEEQDNKQSSLSENSIIKTNKEDQEDDNKIEIIEQPKKIKRKRNQHLKDQQEKENSDVSKGNIENLDMRIASEQVDQQQEKDTDESNMKKDIDESHMEKEEISKNEKQDNLELVQTSSMHFLPSISYSLPHQSPGITTEILVHKENSRSVINNSSVSIFNPNPMAGFSSIISKQFAHTNNQQRKTQYLGEASTPLALEFEE